MIFEGQIIKMLSQIDTPIQYYLNLSGDLLCLNQLFDKKLRIKHVCFQCLECKRNTPIFRMGFCKKCFFESPYASESILKPELSQAHLEIEERNLEVERLIQLQPHIVYLAYTGDIKVGVTRESQIPTRWIDQGATFALPIARTNNRYEAGIIEVELKKHISDKTNWRKMLQDKPQDNLNLTHFKNQIIQYFPEESKKFILEEQNLWKLYFPYTAPEKISSISLDKNSEFERVLIGIKGQYLCFSTGEVFNIRNHEGYVIEFITTI